MDFHGQSSYTFQMPDWWYEKDERDWIFEESEEVRRMIEREAEDYYSYLPDD